MRKVVFSLVMALCVVFTFTFGASAHTIPSSHPASHKVRPYSTGGGCGGLYSSSSGDIKAEACISLDPSGNLKADTYVTFNPFFPKGYITSCVVQILILSNHGQYQGAFQQYNCVVAASNKETAVHFGPVSTQLWNFGDYANGVVNVKMTYSAGSYSVLNNAISERIYL